MLALIGFTVVGLPAPAAVAHDNLLDAVPAAGETVTQATEIVLTFSGELIEFSESSLAQVQGPDGLYYETSCSTIDRTALTTPVQLGGPGVYSVVWNAVSSHRDCRDRGCSRNRGRAARRAGAQAPGRSLSRIGAAAARRLRGAIARRRCF